MRELPSQDCFLEEKEFLWIDWERIRRCPHEEKQKLLPYIERLQKLQHRTRIIGVLRALLRELKQTDDPLERLGMQMILNSNFDKVPSVLAHFISSTANLTDADYLRYVIFYSYLCLSLGDHHPRFVEIQLQSYLGIEFIKPQFDYFGNMEKWEEEIEPSELEKQMSPEELEKYFLELEKVL